MATSDPTSVWICFALVLALFGLRLGLRIWRKERWNQGDYWVVSAAIFMTIRTIGTHIVLIWGSAATLSEAERAMHQSFSPKYIYRLQTAAKLLLLCRLCLANSLWCLKLAVFDFLRQIIRTHWHRDMIVYSYLSILLATWIAATITVFTECHPFQRWWQIYPDPGGCERGFHWLLTYEAGNMVTDAMLLALPFPLLFKARIKWAERLRLCSIFSLGLLLIAICITRMIQCLQNSHRQLSRSTWASIETVAGAIVACIPSIYRSLVVGKKQALSTLKGQPDLSAQYGTSHPSQGLGSPPAQLVQGYISESRSRANAGVDDGGDLSYHSHIRAFSPPSNGRRFSREVEINDKEELPRVPSRVWHSDGRIWPDASNLELNNSDFDDSRSSLSSNCISILVALEQAPEAALKRIGSEDNV